MLMLTKRLIESIIGKENITRGLVLLAQEEGMIAVTADTEGVVVRDCGDGRWNVYYFPDETLPIPTDIPAGLEYPKASNSDAIPPNYIEGLYLYREGLTVQEALDFSLALLPKILPLQHNQSSYLN